MKFQDQILGFMVALTGALAWFDGVQESGFFYGLAGALLASVAPGTCWRVVFLRRIRNEVHSASFAGALAVSAIGLLVYSFYAVTGPAAPDTAGHMHVLLFPIVYLIGGWAVFVPFFLIDVWRNKRSDTEMQPTR